MELSQKECKIIIVRKDFSVYYNKGANYFIVEGKDWSQKFYILSGCDSLVDWDIVDMSSFSMATYFKDQNKEEIIWTVKSNIWDKKYYLEIYDEYMVYSYNLSGNSEIDSLRFFAGIENSEIIREKHESKRNFNDHLQISYEDVFIGYESVFPYIWGMDPNNYGKWKFNKYERAQISCHADLDFCGGNFAFAPSVLAFVASDNNTYMLFGIIAEENEYTFSEFLYSGMNGMCFSLNYWGNIKVDGTFNSPQMVIIPGNSMKEVVINYRKLTEKSTVRSKRYPIPGWWMGPLVCGWGQQSYMGDLFRIRSPKERTSDMAVYDMCTQANYESFVNILEENQIPWSIICVDARWTISAGEKIIDIGRWPDMKRFVEKIHEKGKKVILWWGLWETEGLPEKWCITYNPKLEGNRKNRYGRTAKFGGLQSGCKIAPDPTIKEYKEYLIKQIKMLFSDAQGGIGIDGLKIDHVAATPGVYGMQFPQGSLKLSGIELLHYFQKFVYDTCKQIKPDCLIIGQSVGNLFNDCEDMVRLGDCYCASEKNLIAEMSYRASIIQWCMPDMRIDPDNWPMPNLRAHLSYLEFQKKFNFNSLYYFTALDTTGEVFDKETYNEIRRILSR